MKLYKVILDGMRSSASGPCYGISYVVAINPDEAYKKVRSFLDNGEIGFINARRLLSVELVADSDRYGESDYLLFIDGTSDTGPKC